MQNIEDRILNADRRTLNVKIADLAIEYASLKVPYQHRGTSRNGCDCTGMLIAIARELGYLKRYVLRKYPPDWNLHAGAGNQVIEELSKVADELSKSKASIGDIAVMAFGKCPAHCGIIVDDQLTMVHSLSTNKCCTYGLLKNSLWQSRWLTTFRLNQEKLKQCS
jgi:cell wall-associated NlpC family hydrolase